ncbi:MAG: phosphoribosylamine--glycine ligase [Bacteroidales bacterium]
MNILLLGSGGREHALARGISQSPKTDRLFVAPGNAGTASIANNINLQLDDFSAIKQFVLENQISMVVVGPEQPLVDGIHDYFLSEEALKNVVCIGPQKTGAQLEGSKDFSKAFMLRHHIPSARYKTFTAASIQDAKLFLRELKVPYVLKADGLAAGKGVLILNRLDEAEKGLDEMLIHSKFGEASNKVVIEEYLSGIEMSVFVLTDGIHYKILPSAKDYKRIGQGDTGLNTGGMGAVSPVLFADTPFMQKVEEQIVKPTIAGLQKEKIPYQGFLFIGLMNVEGNPYVIEYNVRMGDPETEVVIPRIQSDLVALFEAVGTQSLDQIDLQIDPRFATCVMMTAAGYPQAYPKGDVIHIQLSQTEDTFVFHAGTTQNEQGAIVTHGGRVIAAVSMAETLEIALHQTYLQVDKIKFAGKYFRSDIGKDLQCK